MPDEKPRNLREALKGKLSVKEMKMLITSFDSVGNIAVIQVPKELEKKAKLIGEALLQVNHCFETVCVVTGGHKGKYRVQPVKVVAGRKNRKALYRESGCSFRVDLGKVFFSPRLATERLRIARLIKPGETVGAFFAGVGPFPVVFAKNSGMGKAFAVELNPHAYKGMLHNIALNKVQARVETIEGDVNEVVPKMLFGKCDRVVMPLPEGSANFLESALLALKPTGGIVHFYRFVEKKDREKPLREIKAATEKAGMRLEVLLHRRVRSFSASKEQVVVDFSAKQREGVSEKEFLERTKGLGLGRKGFDFVVGIGKGGKKPAELIAKELGVGRRLLGIRFRDKDNKPLGKEPVILGKPAFAFKGKRILLVDDVCNSGKTIAAAKKALRGASLVESLAVNCMKGKADYCLFRLGHCISTPWKK